MIRKASNKDLDLIMDIIRDIVIEMKKENIFQWDETYPTYETFKNDILNSELYVKCEGSDILGFACINKIEAKEYEDLTWSTNSSALVIHRMGVNLNFRKKGVAKEFIEFTEKMALENKLNYIKVDTYSRNNKMNSLLLNRGFNFIGTVKFRGKEEPFNCYDKVIK